MSVSNNNNNVCLPQCCSNMNNVDEYGDRSITAAANNNEEEYCNEDLIMREIRPDSPFDEENMDADCGISQTLSQTLGMRDCDIQNEINEPTVVVLSDAAAAATAAVVNEVSASSSEDNTISDSSSTVSEDTTDYSLEFRNTALQSSLGIGTKQRSSPNRVWDISKMKSSPKRSSYQKITDENDQTSKATAKKVNSSNSKIKSMKGSMGTMKFSRFSPSFRDGDSQQYITVNDDEEEVVCNKLLSCSGNEEVYEKEGVVTITANKLKSYSKVGLIFTRSKSSSSTLSNDNIKEAIISGVTDDSIFNVYKSDLVNSTVLAVNDIQVTSAKHAANLVANAINEVRLVIVHQHHNKQQQEDTNEMVDISNSLELELQNHEKRMIQAKIDRAKRSSIASKKVSLNAVLDVVNENYDEECMSIDPDISVYDSVDSDDEDMKEEGHTQEEKEQFLLDIQKKKDEKILKQRKKNVLVETSDDVSNADWSHADVIQSAFGKKNDAMMKSIKISTEAVTPDQAVSYSSPVLDEDTSILPEQSDNLVNHAILEDDTNVKSQETVVSPDSSLTTTTESKKIKKKRISVKRALALIVKEVTEQATETLPPVADKSDDVQLTPDTLVDGAVVEPNAAAASAEDIMNDLNINDSKDETKDGANSETTEGKTHYITVDEDNLNEQQPHHPLARVLSNTTNPDAVEVKKSPSMVEGFVAATERASSYINQSIMTSLSYGEESVVNAKDEVIESLVDAEEEENVDEGADGEPDMKEPPIDDDEPSVKKDQVEEQSELIVATESPVTKRKKSFFAKRSQKNSVANEKIEEPTDNAQPESPVQTPVKKKKSFLKRFKKSSKPPQEVAEVSDKDATDDEDADSVQEHDISLDVTASGDIEIQTPSSRGPFDCTLSPISVKSPSDKVNVTRTSSVPASVATASFSLSSNEEQQHATPPTNKSIPQTPQAPIKISQGWNVASFLFGSPQEGPPSPCASILGATPAECCSCESPSSSGSKDFADIDEPLTVECRLNSIGNDSIKISMERNEMINKTSTTESVSLSELGPPQVNRKLDFDGLCQETFQSRAVDVATVYRDDNSFARMEDPKTPRRSPTNNTWEDIKEFALAKKTAFEIIKRKSPRNGGKYTKNDITMETLNVTETSML